MARGAARKAEAERSAPARAAGDNESSSSEDEEADDPIPAGFSPSFRRRVRQLRDRKNTKQVNEFVANKTMDDLVRIAAGSTSALSPTEAQQLANAPHVTKIEARGGRSVRVVSHDGKPLLYLLRGGLRHSEPRERPSASDVPSEETVGESCASTWVPEDDAFVTEFCDAAWLTEDEEDARGGWGDVLAGGNDAPAEVIASEDPAVALPKATRKRPKAPITPSEDEEERVSRPVRPLPEEDPFHLRTAHIIRTTFSEYRQRTWQKSDRRYRSETAKYREQAQSNGRPFGTNLYGMCKMQGHHKEGEVDKLGRSFWGTAEDPLRTKTIFRALPTLWLGLSIMMEMLAPGAYDLYRHAFRRLRHRNIFADVVGSPHLLFLAYSLVVNRQVAAHFDDRDPRYGWAGMTVFGQFVGGDLFFPDLDLRLQYRPGDIVIFHSAILRHCVLNFSGERYALVAFSHEDQVLDSKNGITKAYLNDATNWDRRLPREIRCTARVRHPGVVPMSGAGGRSAFGSSEAGGKRIRR